jgi:hypothetical protein
MTDNNTSAPTGYFTQERIQGDLDYKRAQPSRKQCLIPGSYPLLNSTNYRTSTLKLSLPCSRKYIRIMLDSIGIQSDV